MLQEKKRRMFHLEEGVCNKETEKQQLWQEGGQKVSR